VNPEDDVEALVSEVEVLERRAQEPHAAGGDVRGVPLRRASIIFAERSMPT
jgi:hypothetical protein